MKVLTVNGEQFQAEKVYKTGDSVAGYTITGYIGGHEVFKHGGISDLSMYKLADEGGLTGDAQYDMSEEEIAQNTINSLGSQLFEAQTQLLQAENDKVTLGQQLFSLQTQLMTKEVL